MKFVERRDNLWAYSTCADNVAAALAAAASAAASCFPGWTYPDYNTVNLAISEFTQPGAICDRCSSPFFKLLYQSWPQALPTFPASHSPAIRQAGFRKSSFASVG